MQWENKEGKSANPFPVWLWCKDPSPPFEILEASPPGLSPPLNLPGSFSSSCVPSPVAEDAGTLQGFVPAPQAPQQLHSHPGDLALGPHHGRPLPRVSLASVDPPV